MAGKPKKHLVDGEYISVKEAADRLGVTAQQLYGLTHSRGIGLQTAVRLVRDNLALGQGRAARYMVDGRWMTVRDMAGALGMSVAALRSYMHKHKIGLAEAAEAHRHGPLHKGGRESVLHRVGRRQMTVAEAAAQLGVSRNAVRMHMYKHKHSLAATIRWYERRKVRQAEREILKILRGG